MPYRYARPPVEGGRGFVGPRSLPPDLIAHSLAKAGTGIAHSPSKPAGTSFQDGVNRSSQDGNCLLRVGSRINLDSPHPGHRRFSAFRGAASVSGLGFPAHGAGSTTSSPLNVLRPQSPRTPESSTSTSKSVKNVTNQDPTFSLHSHNILLFSGSLHCASGFTHHAGERPRYPACR